MKNFLYICMISKRIIRLNIHHHYLYSIIYVVLTVNLYISLKFKAKILPIFIFYLYVCKHICCVMNFNEDNVLNPGILVLTWEEFITEFSFSAKRRELIKGLEKVIRILEEANCTEIYIDGSFATGWLEPNDWDACFDGDPKSIYYVFTHYPLTNVEKQKELYGGELYTVESPADAYGTKFIDYFQQITHTDRKKGIIKIELNKK